MPSLVIFNLMNDLIYCDFEKSDLQKLQDAVSLHCNSPISGSSEYDQAVDLDIIVQLFSPLLTSYQVLSSHLNNPYQTIRCQDGTNILFMEHLSYVFIGIGHETVQAMQTFLQFYVHYATVLFGPLLFKLKNSAKLRGLLKDVMKTALLLFESDPTVAMQALRNQVLDPAANKIMYKTLSKSLDVMKTRTDLNAAHSLLLSKGKLLNIYSRRGAKELTMFSVIDVIVLSSINYAACLSRDKITQKTTTSSQELDIFGRLIFLYLDNHLTPYILYSSQLSEQIDMAILCQAERTPICDNLNHILLLCNEICGKNNQQLLGLSEEIEQTCKRLSDNLKKACIPVDDYSRYKALLNSKWESLKRTGLVEYLHSEDNYMSSRLQVTLQSFQDTVAELFRILCSNDASVEVGLACASLVFAEAANSLEDTMKSKHLNSHSCNLLQYLEEFPGLVHFMLIDRTENLLVSPDVDATSKNAIPSLWKKITQMVGRVRKNLNSSHFSVLWKDQTFYYSYFLWVEDYEGHVLKIKKLSDNVVKQCRCPKIFLRDFYRLACEEWFPDRDFHSLKVNELYCIHLNLATPLCIIEHCRRLAATLREEIRSKSTLHII